MIKIGILGATGYTALELIKILLRHPEAEIVAVTSRQADQPHVGDTHHQLAGRLDLRLENCEPEELADRVDCVFSCLPHAASASFIKPLADLGKRVIDFSADYRLRDCETYVAWYGGTHPDPSRVGRVPYGLPEWFREEIKKANLIANPGCYPTSAILALAPLLKAGVVAAEDLIIDSKSGVSGAGRTPKLGTLFPECNESFSAYGVGQHRHSPEIQQLLGLASGTHPTLIFTPHLVPMDRGILTTAYARLVGKPSTSELLDLLRETYRAEPFVQVVSHLPATKDTSHTNFCHVTARVVGDRAITISVIDNLIKGASGAAVQNFNLLYGFPETMALL